MANSTKNDWFAALVTAALATVAAFSLGAQELHLKTKTSIASGLHLWYELKADPEDLNNLIVCGTKMGLACQLAIRICRVFQRFRGDLADRSRGSKQRLGYRAFVRVRTKT